MTTFPSVHPPNTCDTHRKASASKQKSISSDARTQLTDFSQISAHAFGAWRHSHLLVTISIWNFYFDICEWHILPVRVWTHALMLYLTNPCAKRKVLSLTKPKGKICKTKFPGHYITSRVAIDRSQKLINPFVSETTESACICVCICIIIADITKLYNIPAIAAKVYNALLLNCIKSEIKKILWKNQNGFPRNRSTTSEFLTIYRGNPAVCRFL